MNIRALRGGPLPDLLGKNVIPPDGRVPGGEPVDRRKQLQPVRRFETRGQLQHAINALARFNRILERNCGLLHRTRQYGQRFSLRDRRAAVAIAAEKVSLHDIQHVTQIVRIRSVSVCDEVQPQRFSRDLQEVHELLRLDEPRSHE